MSSAPLRMPSGGVFEGDASALTWWLASYRSSQDSPERRLRWAVLEDAIHCLRRPVRRLRHGFAGSAEASFAVRDDALAREEARRWVASGDQSWPFSFVNLCAALGLEHDWLRKRIAALGPQVGGSGRPKVRSESGDRCTPGITRTKGEAAANRGTVWSVRSRGAG